MEKLIEVQGLSFTYPNGQKALQDIEFYLKPNEFLGLVGPNGSGKTTLFRLIIGELEAQQKQVLLLGDTAAKNKHRIGYVPQHHSFNTRCPLSVRDVILTGLLGKGRWFGGYHTTDHLKVDEALENLDIEELQKSSINELSGGQLQKVMIARALVSHPAVLILDEPTAHLDATSAEKLYELLKKLKSKFSIILSSHDVDAVTQYSDRVMGLNQKIYHRRDDESGDDFMLRLSKVRSP